MVKEEEKDLRETEREMGEWGGKALREAEDNTGDDVAGPGCKSGVHRIRSVNKTRGGRKWRRIKEKTGEECRLDG
ncbi:hypothetical protein L6164_012737 [Bauhinia variegata]|uniref:Uncharacterized protein n=1 Tax=Bauhinia variegata TaxID=167791 RepID=A0ACB9PBB8_BAUVA|nr:hypothetical protein L6164_012737 [Bauhinia variegata]